MVSRFRHRRCVLTLTALSGPVVALALLAGCTAGSPTSAPTTTVPRPTTTASPTTTTVAVPSHPLASPEAASAAFIQDWKQNDRAAAATVATGAAVAALFAVPYTNQTVQSRGCSSEFLPRKCSWGPYGGGSGALYELEVLPSGSNWYVSNATVES